MQTRIGVELSSPTCLVRYRLFYRREILLYGCGVSAREGGGALRWCLDSPCGGSITDPLVWHLSFFGVNINVGLSSQLMCV